MTERVIDIRGLRKSYGDVEAVRGIDLHVDHGEVFALLGPNGAGKTTTVEILEGYRERTDGEVSVLGHDPARRRPTSSGGSASSCNPPASTPISPSARRSLSTPASIPPRGTWTRWSTSSGLAEKRNTRVSKLSGGQQRRLDVAVALAGDPELLFLDEPTTGFDPNARRNAWEIVKNLTYDRQDDLPHHPLHGRGPVPREPRRRDHGRGESWPRAPRRRWAGAIDMRTRVRFRVPEGRPAPPGSRTRRSSPTARSRSGPRHPTKVVHELTAWALEHDFVFDALEVTQPSLEDVYLDLTGGNEHERREEAR